MTSYLPLGLRRIVLIDSFIAKKSLCLNVDSNANLSGTNGAGKTTCLRLIPFFYGVEPGQLENQAAGKKSFVDWYLPRPTSLIIYEYARDDGLCCAVVYRHPTGTKPAYRFVRGGFELANFCRPSDDDSHQFCEGRELANHWRELSLEFSSQLEIVVDYRAVLQHDRELLNRSARAKQLRPLAARFCLGHAKNHMRHLEKVSLAILGRQGSMDKIKLMLADIMQEDGVHVPPPPKHHENKRISEDLMGLRDFKRHVPQFRQTLADYHNLNEGLAELGSLKFTLKQKVKTIEYQQGDLQQELKDKVSQIEKEEKAWRNDKQWFEDNIAKALANEKELDNRITQLQSRYDLFESQDLEIKSKELDNINQFQSRLHQVKESHSRLVESVAVEQAENDKLKDKEVLRHQHEKEKWNGKIQQQEKEISVAQEEHLQSLNELDVQCHQEIQTLLVDNQEAREKLLEEKTLVSSEISNTSPHEDQQAELDQLSAVIDSLDEKIFGKEQELNQCQVDVESLSTLNDNGQADYSQAKKELRDQQLIHEEIVKQLNPGENTWLNKLRHSDQDWMNSIAKIVKTDILFDQQLSPTLLEQQQGVYGWNLDLSHLPQSDVALSIDKLQAKLAQQEHVIDLAEKKVSEATSQAKKNVTNLQVAKQKLDACRRELNKIKNERISMKESLKALRDKINDDLAVRREEAKKRLSELEEFLEQQNKRHQDNLKERESGFNALKQEKIATWSIDKSRLQQGIESLQSSLDEEIKHHQLQLSQIENNFDAILVEKGIEINLKKQLAEDIALLEEKIKMLEESRDVIHEYRNFIKYDWPQKNVLEKELATAEQSRLKFEKEKEEAKQKFNKEQKEIRAAKKAIERQLTENNQLLSELKNGISRALISEVEEIIELPVTTLIQRTSELIEVNAKLVKKVNDGILTVQNEISRRGDSQIANSWRQLSDEVANRYGLESDDNELMLKLPLALEKLIDTDIPLLEQALLETMRVIGNQLSQFYQGLRDINQRIKLQASRISRSIESYCEIDALANIQIDMKSKIEELDYWEQLNAFEKMWESWQHQVNSTFPSEQLISQLAEILASLATARVTQAIASLFELHIKMEENGRAVVIRNDNDLTNASSTGLSYLALCAIFMGITRLLCSDKNVIVHWPIDELGIIAPENISHLFAMLHSAGIVMLGGFPNTDPDLLKHFKHKHLIDRLAGIKVMAVEESQLLQAIKAKETKAAEGVMS